MRTNRVMIGCAVVLCGALAAGAGMAAPPEKVAPSADRGRELAEKLCSGCHLTGTGTPSATTVGIPTFRSIADRPGLTAREIENVLIDPHPPMPDARLTNAEIRDIIAYIESLRSNPALPPLLPQTPPPKPKYPTPS